MSVTDIEFAWFYQDCIGYLLEGEDSSMPFMGGRHVSYRVGCTEEEWYEKAIAALTRLGISGLICCRCDQDNVHDIRVVLRELFLDRSSMTWDGCYFELTESGEKLAKEFHLEEEDEESLLSRVLPGFREELGRIFDGHGVGFDVDLPYDKLLSLKSD